MALSMCLVVFTVTSLGAGSAATRVLTLHPAESLCVAIATSWLIVFLTFFCGWVYGIEPSITAPLLLLLNVVGLLFGWPQLLKWMRCRFTRSMATAYCALLLWCLVIQAQSPLYAYGNWFGDWFEHYQRMYFFTGHFPLETVFLGRYLLPARPPLQNVCQAYIGTLAGHSFPVFQVSSTCFATLLCLPVHLMVRRLAQAPKPSVWGVTAMLALSWPFVVNATFTWTKALAAFYVTLGLALYLRHSFSRQLLSFAALAAGVLTHYSSALVLVPLVLWHLMTEARTYTSIKNIIAIGLPAVLILVPWIAFVRCHFPDGVLGTTSSASMIADARTAIFTNAALNAVFSLVPIYQHRVWLMQGWAAGSEAVFLRDVLFMVTMTSFVGSIGISGLMIIAHEIATGQFGRSAIAAHQTTFWFWLFSTTLIGLGIAHPTEPDWGLCHIAMLPFVVSSTALLAGAWPAVSTHVRMLFAFVHSAQSAGVLLNAILIFAATAGSTQWPLGSLSAIGTNNLALKLAHQLPFLADLVRPCRSLMLCMVAIGLALWIRVLVLLVDTRPRPYSATGKVA